MRDPASITQAFRLGDDGMPTGELKGPDAMMPLGIHTGFDRDLLACDEPGLAQICANFA